MRRRAADCRRFRRTASGLAQIHAFVKNQGNQIAEQIYGGDLLGNVWRIDVSAVDSYKNLANTPLLFARLTDPGGAGQPVTTAPQIEIDITNGVDRYVFIGTGRLLDTTRSDRAHDAADANDVRDPRRHARRAFDDRARGGLPDPAAQ